MRNSGLPQNSQQNTAYLHKALQILKPLLEGIKFSKQENKRCLKKLRSHTREKFKDKVSRLKNAKFFKVVKEFEDQAKAKSCCV